MTLFCLRCQFVGQCVPAYLQYLPGAWCRNRVMWWLLAGGWWHLYTELMCVVTTNIRSQLAFQSKFDDHHHIAATYCFRSTNFRSTNKLPNKFVKTESSFDEQKCPTISDCSSILVKKYRHNILTKLDMTLFYSIQLRGWH